jgi:hypothetical protein
MRDADKARFATVMYWLAGKYPLTKGRGATREEVPRELTKEDLADWFEALQDLHIERIEWGAKWLFGHKTFFPKPGELREAAEQAPPPKVVALPAPENKLDQTPPEVVRSQIDALMRKFEGKFGKSERSAKHGRT